jgi:hypothetical protein
LRFGNACNEVTEAEKDNPGMESWGSVPRLVVPIAASGVDVSCCSSTTMSETMGRTSKFPLLETIHCHVQVQENIDPVRNKDPIMYRGQALFLELLELAEETWARGQSQSSWQVRLRGASQARHQQDADVVVALGVEDCMKTNTWKTTPEPMKFMLWYLSASPLPA